MFRVLHQRNFVLLWMGQLLSLLGDWALFMGLPFYVYTRTGSTIATGAMFIVQTLPYILFGSMAGVFADRWDRKHTMIIADIARALLLLILLLLVRWPNWFWLIYPVTFFETFIGQFYYPARTALLPIVVGEEDLLPANTLSGQTIALASLIGPSLGGLLAYLWGLPGVILVDSVSYLASAFLAGAMTVSIAFVATEHKASSQEVVARKSAWQEWIIGLRLVVTERSLVGLFSVMGLITIVQGISNVLLIVYVRVVLHGGAQVFGWLATAQGVGSLAGGFLIAHLSKKISTSRLIQIGACLAGICLLARNHLVGLILSLILTAAFGSASLFASASEQTLLQKLVNDQFRGRVFGTWATAQSTMMLIGMMLASVLGNAFGVILILDGAAGLLLVAAFLALLLLHSGGRRKYNAIPEQP